MESKAAGLRQQVESELNIARSNIEAITNKRTELRTYWCISNTRQVLNNGLLESSIHKGRGVNGNTAPKRTGRATGRERGDVDERGALLWVFSSGRVSFTCISADDFRTALQNALSCVSSMVSLAHPAPSTPATASSSSTAPPQNVTEIDRQWIDVMSRLVVILQRNLRVGYELNLLEVLQA